MNLIQGKIVLSASERDEALAALSGMVFNTLKSGTLDCETVLNACDALSKAVGNEHAAMLESIGVPPVKAAEYIRQARLMLQKDTLIKRLETELGGVFSLTGAPRITETDDICMKETVMPLGVLLHIAAGNQYGLAFYSVIEGLLTGNINIVKLPSGDDGLSAFILSEMIKTEPRLKEYIYLFDYTSKDAAALEKLAGIADAVVVWGGDEAIRSIRSIAKPDTKIIEWGHKLSFAYATKAGLKKQTLEVVAVNIINTNQLLCSSCQGIYLDTESMDGVHEFCERFLPVLEQARESCPEKLPIEIRAQTGLSVYIESLKSHRRPCRIFRGKQTALLAYEDSELEASVLYGNWG